MTLSEKKTRSAVWADGAFKYKTYQDGTHDKSTAVCQQCDLSMTKHSSTPNLKKHLGVKPPGFFPRTWASKWILIFFCFFTSEFLGKNMVFFCFLGSHLKFSSEPNR